MTPETLLLSGWGTPAQRFRALRIVTTPERTAMLQALPYPEFLRTPYWRIITAHLRASRRRCNRCQATRGLNVHHRTYRNHGREHAHLTDLEVLCRDCHAHEHGYHPIPTARGAWRSAGELLPAACAAMGVAMYQEGPS